MILRRILILCGLILALTTTAAAAERALLRAALNSITASDLQTHVDYLADDVFEGREAGSRGGRAAGVYLTQQLEKRNLRGMGDDGGYFQPFGKGFRNILAILPGSDPELKDEIVVVGGHYDHVGYGDRTNSFGPFGYVHNGADDNASGVAGLLEVIDAFLSAGVVPRRSILFAFWDGEEKGLVGSKHWVANPSIPLGRVVAAINLDMIGRMKNNKLEVYGTRTAQGLRRLVSESNTESQLELDFSWEMKSNSDHHTFFAKSIPVLMLHTGLHDDYHRPSDDAHLVNSEGMQQAARLMFQVILSLSDRDQLAGFRPESRGESPAGQRTLERSLTPLPPRLGVRWRPQVGTEGVTLSEVRPGTPAERAGFREGDRIVRFNGQRITDSETFRREVLTTSSPVEVWVQRRGEEGPAAYQVDLNGQPSRIGISWRIDDAEPGTVLLTRVVPASPAALAGMRVGDRIYEIQGKQFSDSDQLYKLLTTMPGPMTLNVERAGSVRAVELSLDLRHN